ncbi:hypothetical protein [Halorubrum distributum]|uniref:Uncharacterized protein n=1 Tax=Halorubrum distributum JCM 10247 TaxID=1227486 RepID=M0DJR5_9EURY|nr:hypothetical protein [Halorubrum terrestre]ELZ35746.1 hypothetical protein C473_03464 [Halorubrum terrestre JCM 10247]
MATIDTESAAHWVAEAWDRKSGSLNLRDALKKGHRGLVGTAVIGFAVAGIMLAASGDAAASGNLLAGGLAFVLSAGLAWLGLDSLDLLDCELREDHECRRCRKETNRWRADESEEGR